MLLDLLLTIDININPEIKKFGGLLLTWHGVFTAVGIAAGVYVALLLGRRLGFIDDDVYSAALIAIPCGIIGARALFVVENWSKLGAWTDIFRINEGGISIYGAVIGGALGAIGYALVRRLPLRRGLDAATPATLLGMAIGRIGDIINGEHFAKVSSLPWAVRYINLNSPSVQDLGSPCHLDPVFRPGISDICAQHPAVAYEMLADLLIVGLLLFLIWYWRRDGMAFFTGLLLYSLMRFGVTYLRIDSREIIWGLRTPQVTSLFIIPFAAGGLLYCLFHREEERAPPPAPQPVRVPAGARTAK